MSGKLRNHAVGHAVLVLVVCVCWTIVNGWVDQPWAPVPSRTGTQHCKCVYKGRSSNICTYTCRGVLPKSKFIRNSFINHRYVGGNFTSLPHRYFRGLSLSISITASRLSHVSSTAFTKVNKVKRISLAGNRIRSLPVGVFINQYTLQYLNMSSNLLTQFSCVSWMKVNPNTIPIRSLRHLDLSSNRISGQLTASHVSPFTGLVDLHLDRNYFQQIEAVDMFSDAVRLQELGMSHNRLTVLPREPFSRLLRGVSTSQKNHPAIVRLKGNPVNCGCYLDWVYEAVYGAGDPSDQTSRSEVIGSSGYFDGDIDMRITDKQHARKRKDFLEFLEETKCANFHVDMSLWCYSVVGVQPISKDECPLPPTKDFPEYDFTKTCLNSSQMSSPPPAVPSPLLPDPPSRQDNGVPRGLGESSPSNNNGEITGQEVGAGGGVGEEGDTPPAEGGGGAGNEVKDPVNETSAILKKWEQEKLKGSGSNSLPAIVIVVGVASPVLAICVAYVYKSSLVTTSDLPVNFLRKSVAGEANNNNTKDNKKNTKQTDDINSNRIWPAE